MIIDIEILKHLDISKIKPIKIHPNTLKRIFGFANDFDKKDNNYVNTNNLGGEKGDNVVCKCAEFATWKLLQNAYPMLSKPDISIHSAVFDHDLVATSPFPINLAVKGQDIERVEQGFPRSWVFNRYDKTINRKDPLHYAALLNVDTQKYIVELFAIVSIDKINELNLWSEMKKPSLRTYKKCIKYDDLERSYE